MQGAPDLVIEILSPGTRSKDLEIKTRAYATFGVQEYWVVDPEADTVEVLVRGDTGYRRVERYGKSDTLTSPLFPALDLALDEIFKD